MNIEKLKKEEKIVRKLEKSIHILYENININKNNNFSILNMLTFSFFGWTCASFVMGSAFLIPLTITSISASIWAYLTTTDNSHAVEGEFNKYTAKKFKRISNSNQLMEIFNSSLTKEEKEILNKIFKNTKSEESIFSDYILNQFTKEEIIKNQNQFFEYIKEIEFLSKEEKENFKYKLADKLYLDLSIIKDDDFDDIKNKLLAGNFKGFKNIKIKSNKMIIKSL